MNTVLVLGLLLAAALLVSATGFIRVVWFVSIGYAYSIALMALGIAICFAPVMPLTSWLQLGLLVVYGIRLGTYILLREGKSAYKRELGDVHAREAGVAIPKRFPIWIGVSVLYVAMVVPALSPVLRSAGLEAGGVPASSLAASILAWIGLAVQALGLGIEALADWQKSRFKHRQPDRYCDIGLYRLVRCPNYLGEILVWVGSFVAGFSAFGSWWQWVAASLGLVCIVLIMMGSTKRLEAKQEERYGGRDDYRKFASTVPVLFPFLPVYSLKNIKVFLE